MTVYVRCLSKGMLVADGSPAAQLGGYKVSRRSVEVDASSRCAHGMADRAGAESVLGTGSGERAGG